MNFETDITDEDVCELPPHVIEGIKKSEEQIKNGQYYTYDAVKNLLAKRNWK